jgi:hypothetical protein
VVETEMTGTFSHLGASAELGGSDAGVVGSDGVWVPGGRLGEHSVAAAVRAAVRGDAALLGASNAVGRSGHAVVELRLILSGFALFNSIQPCKVRFSDLLSLPKLVSTLQKQKFFQSSCMQDHILGFARCTSPRI